MSSETATHRERPVTEPRLLDRVALAETAVRFQKEELARIRSLTADLFFNNSEIIIDGNVRCR